MFKLKPYLLQNESRHYEWGTRDEQAFIPELLGSKAETGKPYAELWMGAHPKAPSQTLVDGELISLRELIRRSPRETLGDNCFTKVGAELPFLFKVLSIAEPLSIQTHPDKAQAEKLHAADAEHYPDDNHKPEIAIALDKLTCIMGFRSGDDIQEILKAFPKLSDLTGISGGKEITGIELKELIQRVINLSEIHSSDFESLIDTISDNANAKLEAYRSEIFENMFAKYGYDIGLIFLLLMNVVELNSGEAVFTPAGIPHAYLEGNIIECMANSDNVIRAGFTPKFKDTASLMKVLDFTPGRMKKISPEGSAKELIYNVPASEFKIINHQLRSEDRIEISGGKPEILLIVAGGAELLRADDKLSLSKGQSVFLPAGMQNLTLRCTERTNIFRAIVGAMD